MKYLALAGVLAATIASQANADPLIVTRWTYTYVTPVLTDFSGSHFVYNNSLYLNQDAGTYAATVNFQSVATDIHFYAEGGTTVDPLSAPDHTPAVPMTITTPGGPGQLVGFDYNGVATDTPGLSFLTYGVIGSQYALTFTGGGTNLLDTDGTFHSLVVIDGDWSSASSHTAASYGAGYTLENDFTYDAISNKTTFRISTFDYDGTNPGISFSLLGADVAAVPEPATWVAMIAGFALLGATMRRRKVAWALQR